jgi:antitoxin PrlF
MRLFLDFAMTEALKNNTLQPYTTAMSEAAAELITGMELDDESLEDG